MKFKKDKKDMNQTDSVEVHEFLRKGWVVMGIE